MVAAYQCLNAAPIVLYRIVTVVKFWPVKSTTLVVGALEVSLLIAAVALYVLERR